MKSTKHGKGSSGNKKPKTSDAHEMSDIHSGSEINESDDDKSECRYMLEHSVTVYLTLPSGDEEIITNHKLVFKDKGTGDRDEDEKEDSNDLDEESMDFEYKLCNLISFIKKQGYPIENSFVSYYSADFQVQVNCGPDPIAKSIALCPTDLEGNFETKDLSIQLIFARGIKADLEDQVKAKEAFEQSEDWIQN